MATDRVRRSRRLGAAVLASGALVALAVGPSFAHTGSTSAGEIRHTLLAAERVGAEPDEIVELDQLDGAAADSSTADHSGTDPSAADQADPTESPDATATSRPAEPADHHVGTEQGDQNGQGGDQAGQDGQGGDRADAPDPSEDPGTDGGGSGPGGDSGSSGDSGSGGH